jgi:hypothetical protein
VQHPRRLPGLRPGRRRCQRRRWRRRRGVFDAAVGKIAEGFAQAVQLVVTFWTGRRHPWPEHLHRAGSRAAGQHRLADGTHRGAVDPGLRRPDGDDPASRPAAEAFKGLLLLVLVSGAGVAAVNALVVFGDGYSTWVLNRSTDGQLGERLMVLATVGTQAGLGTGLILIVALLGILASIAQMGLMLVRVGVVTIFAGLLPLAAAGTSTQTGMEYFKRMTSWLLAFVLYKPAAATVYASAF